MKKFAHGLNLLIGIGLGVFFIWYVFHDLNLHSLWIAIKEADYKFLPLYACTVLAYHLLRIYRWHLMLQPLYPFRFSRTFQIGSVGFLSIFLLPFRLGEFVRPYLATEKAGVKFSSVLATVMVERTVDGVVLTLLFFLISQFAPNSNGPELPVDLAVVGRAALLVFLVAFSGIIVLLVLGERGLALARKVAGVFGRRFGARVASMATSFLTGLRVVQGWRRAGAFIFFTMAYWAMNGFGTWILFHSMPSTSHLPLVAGYGLMAVLGIAVMVPNLPGFTGAFQIAVFLALLMYDPSIEKEVAIAVSFIMQAVIMVVQAGCGFPFILTGKVSFVRTVQSSKMAEELLQESSDPAS